MQDSKKMEKNTDGNKYLQNISYKGLRIYMQNLLKFNNKIRNNPVENSQMVWIDIAPKKIY